MSYIEILFRCVGLIYLAGSYFGLRAVLSSASIERSAGASFTAEERAVGHKRRIFIGAMMITTATSGAALLLMSELAVPTFFAALAIQAVWLVSARHFYTANDDSERQGTRQSVHAALVYAVVTLGVVWLWRGGRLLAWDDGFTLAMIIANTVALGGWFVYHLTRQD